MAVPAGYFYKDGAYWNIDGSGPYGISQGGLAYLLGTGARAVGHNLTSVAGVGSLAEQIIKQFTIPMGLLSSLLFFSVSHLATKVGVNAGVTSLQYRLGTTGTVADASVYSTGSWSGSTTVQHSGGFIGYLASSTTLRKMTPTVNITLEAAGGTTAAFPVDVTIPNADANDLILSLTVTCASALDTPSGQRLTIIGY